MSRESRRRDPAAAPTLDDVRYGVRADGSPARRLRRSWRKIANRQSHQVANSTSTDRYPAIFRFVAADVQANTTEEPKLLSFGCSTGEECFTLRGYFGFGRILGVDIKSYNVKVCRDRNFDTGITFERSRRSTIRRGGPYDAIFAMSVLCRWPDNNLESSAGVYPYERFIDTVRLLDESLRIGGLLAIYNASYRFGDTPLAANYEAIQVPQVDDSGFVTLYSVDNRRLVDQMYAPCVFRKLR